MTFPLASFPRRLLVLPVLALAPLSFALTIGDKAPAMEVGALVKGAATDLRKGVHVVEFWATWCDPCKKSIPHLTEMARRYRGRVDFTGVSVWEEGGDQLGQVRRFVAAMGDRMDYNVVWDGAGKAMATNWLTAAKQDGIPAAFLVRDGTVLWIGQPTEGLDEAIARTLAGTFDVAAARAEMDERTAERAKVDAQRAELTKLMQPVFQAMQKKDYDAALDAVARLRSDRPDLKGSFDRTEFSILLTSGSPKLVGFASRVAADPQTDPQTLRFFAGALLEPRIPVENPDYAAALTFAKAAAERTGMKDPAILDAYALALYRSGDRKLALKVQTQAVELAKRDPKMKADAMEKLEGRLETFRKG